MKFKLRKVTGQERHKTGMHLHLECGHSKHVKHAGFTPEAIKEGTAKARCRACRE